MLKTFRIAPSLCTRSIRIILTGFSITRLEELQVLDVSVTASVAVSVVVAVSMSVTAFSCSFRHLS